MAIFDKNVLFFIILFGLFERKLRRKKPSKNTQYWVFFEGFNTIFYLFKVLLLETTELLQM